MDNSNTLPNIKQLKLEAAKLRDQHAKSGPPISLAKSLELLARNYGLADWNTLSARAKTQPKILAVGQLVSGKYLGQKFTGTIKALLPEPDGQLQNATIVFDKAVDVIRFEGMQNLRRQVRVLVDAHGNCPDKTGDGNPIIVFDS